MEKPPLNEVCHVGVNVMAPTGRLTLYQGTVQITSENGSQGTWEGFPKRRTHMKKLPTIAFYLAMLLTTSNASCWPAKKITSNNIKEYISRSVKGDALASYDAHGGEMLIHLLVLIPSSVAQHDPDGEIGHKSSKKNLAPELIAPRGGIGLHELLDFVSCAPSRHEKERN